jgi:S1-C subfamily serine protease
MSERTDEVAAVARAVDPSVVDITVGLAGTRGTVAGTGLILSPAGMVLTNNHVIAGANTITAQVAGAGRRYTATVVGYDVTEDLAVVHLDGAAGLVPAPLGEPGSARVGDAVVAIGNAQGLGGAPRPEPSPRSDKASPRPTTPDSSGRRSRT